MSNRVKCAICGTESHHLGEHLREEHGMTVSEYLMTYPTSSVMSDSLKKRLDKTRKSSRAHPPTLEELKTPFAGLNLPLNLDVPLESCLSNPDAYRAPTFGALGGKVRDAVMAIASGLHTYIHGVPGTGKDALVHAYCAATRTPSEIFQVQPDTDIESWFFTQGINKEGDFWREGLLLKMLRDGYTTSSGRKIPYLILISDFDRADRSQAEALRLVMDSIKGRIMGPSGKVFSVFPGTVIVATANSAGTGDERGMCISSNPIDSSILDRFQAGVKFSPMDWRDEVKICDAKFPLLHAKFPELLTNVGRATSAIRKEIEEGKIYAEFSHRGVCNWLSSCNAILRFEPKPGKHFIMRAAALGFIDKMPDEATRESIRALISRALDPHVPGGTLKQNL